MAPCCKSAPFCACMAVMAVLLVVVSIFAAEVGMPMFMASASAELSVMDTAAKFAPMMTLQTFETNVTFLHLANAHDLQTVNPRPKPIFEE